MNKEYNPTKPSDALEILFLQAKQVPANGTIQDTLNIAAALQKSYDTLKVLLPEEQENGERNS